MRQARASRGQDAERVVGDGVGQFPWIAVDPTWARAGRRGAPQPLGGDAEAVAGAGVTCFTAGGNT